MRFNNPNLFIINYGFSVRWTLIAFIIIVTTLFIYILLNKLTGSIYKTHRTWLLPTLIYLSTVPIYYFKEAIGAHGTSSIYIVAEFLCSIESLIVITLIASLIYGFRYKNSYTFINFFCKALAIIEAVYIVSYYLTNRMYIDRWYDYLGVLFLGVPFIVLYSIDMDPIKSKSVLNIDENCVDNRTNLSILNLHDPINRYDSLFALRKHQVNEVMNIIESSKSKSGYSIFVCGEWGIGKTSFANGLLNKLIENKKTVKTKNADIFNIRINAMELDDTVSLITYFFTKLEEILKANKIYVGIESEYKELIASISGTVIHESVSGFLSKKLSNGCADYRANIDKMNQLLNSNLENSRIIIVIDDIDRCSGEKAKSFLFIMKEIATMSHCITIFLADIEKLKSSCNLDDSFFEKFFNHTLQLSSVSYSEQVSDLEQFFDSSAELSCEIEKVLMKYDDNIKKLESESNFNISDPQKRQEQKDYIEKCINHNIMAKEQLLNDLSNPRRKNKVYEYYDMLVQRIIKIRECCPTEKRIIVDAFLDKVDYKKQLSLLSIMSGLYNREFTRITANNIYKYISSLTLRLESGEKHEEQVQRVDSLLKDEWYDVFRALNKDYRTDEILRFVNCILSDINELPNISNSYSTHEDIYISDIKGGNLPDDLSLSQLLSMIYRATYNNLPERKLLVHTIMNLYKHKMNTNAVDDAFILFSDNEVISYLSNDTPVLQMFWNIFCEGNYRINNTDKTLNIFRSFISRYLWRNLRDLCRYFLPISSREDISYKMWDDLSDLSLTKTGCENILDTFCEKCEEYLDITKETSGIPAISRLEQILKKVDMKYEEFKMSESVDVKKLSDNAKHISKEINYLLKIENFINECNDGVDYLSNYVSDNSIDNLGSIIDKYFTEFSQAPENIQRERVEKLLERVYGGDHSIDSEIFSKLDNLVQEFSKVYRPVSSWRQMLIYIMKNKVNVSH